MDIYYRKKDGKIYNSVGRIFKLEQLQDQIDDGRVRIESFDHASEDTKRAKTTLFLEETEWRNDELLSTDVLMIQANSGEMGRDKISLKAYRQALRDYPNHPDFPNNERPSI